MLSGVGAMWYGDQLEHHVLLSPTEFLYIPADMPHLPYNPSTTESAVAVIARTYVQFPPSHTSITSFGVKL